ncbi:unnamed protein product [Dicrocoelium dendriticum]|nr:unnamed protein product [Dicrocoelium dendriticum]
MANYVPNTRIPMLNIIQELQNAKMNNMNEEVDIQVPHYLVDRRILKAIELKNRNYLESYMKQCPRNIERYFFLETVSPTSPLIRSILVSNLLGFALLYRSIPCLTLLLELASDPFQATYFIEYVTQSEVQKKIVIYEAPAFVLLSGSLQEKYKKECVSMFMALRNAETELHVPIALRRQYFEPPAEPASSTIRFADAWECMEKEIEKKGGETVQQNKLLLRDLKAVYRANKFDRLS